MRLRANAFAIIEHFAVRFPTNIAQLLVNELAGFEFVEFELLGGRIGRGEQEAHVLRKRALGLLLLLLELARQRRLALIRLSRELFPDQAICLRLSQPGFEFLNLSCRLRQRRAVGIRLRLEALQFRAQRL